MVLGILGGIAASYLPKLIGMGMKKLGTMGAWGHAASKMLTPAATALGS
jgi:hypothetical protein